MSDPYRTPSKAEKDPLVEAIAQRVLELFNSRRCVDVRDELRQQLISAQQAVTVRLNALGRMYANGDMFACEYQNHLVELLAHEKYLFEELKKLQTGDQ